MILGQNVFGSAPTGSFGYSLLGNILADEGSPSTGSSGGGWAGPYPGKINRIWGSNKMTREAPAKWKPSVRPNPIRIIGKSLKGK